MSALQTSLAQAGKLKQFCQAVLDVVGAAEQMGPMEQAIEETRARLVQLQQTEAVAKTVLAETQAKIDAAGADVSAMLATAKQVTEQMRRETEHTIAMMMAEAKDAVRQSYEAKAKLDAEVVAQHQELQAVQADTSAQEQKLAEAKAAIARLLR